MRKPKKKLLMILFWKYFYHSSACCIATSITVSIFSICILAVFLYNKPKIEDFYHQNFIITTTSSLTEQETVELNNLIIKGKIIAIEDIFGNTLNYYDSLISILTMLIAFLVSLFGIFSIISWFSFKGKIKNEVQEIKYEMLDDIDRKVESYIDNERYQSWLKDVVKKCIADNQDWLFSEISNSDNIDVDYIVEKVMDRLDQNKITLKMPISDNKEG